MIKMLAILFSILGTWLVLGALFYWYEETSNNTLYNVLDRVITLPWLAVFAIIIVVWYPFLLLWKFFRNAVKGVSVNCWKRAQIKRYLKLGNFRLCYDATAKALCNKLFLVRIVKPAEQINHKSKR
jgi:ABC-type proline/glycine betaine transport system permease subunit